MPPHQFARPARRLRLGDPSTFLPLLNYILLEFSPNIYLDLKKKGFEVCWDSWQLPLAKCDLLSSDALPSVVFQLQGKTDARFTDVAFRVLRDYLRIKPVITPAQFLEQVCPPSDSMHNSPAFLSKRPTRGVFYQGFAVERKVLLLLDAAKACKQKHDELVLQQRLVLPINFRQHCASRST